MKPVYITSLILLFITAILSSGSGSGYIVVNSSESSPGIEMKGWGNTFGRKEILEWAVARQMVPVQDLPPVKDDRAYFTGKYGSTVIFTGLNKEKKYTLWIDFLKYNKNSIIRYDTALKVRVGVPDSPAVPLFLELKLQNLAPDELFRLDLPYRLTSGGSVELNFREQSSGAGIWAVWDMILTAETDLPVFIESAPAPMNIEDRTPR